MKNFHCLKEEWKKLSHRPRTTHTIWRKSRNGIEKKKWMSYFPFLLALSSIVHKRYTQRNKQYQTFRWQWRVRRRERERARVCAFGVWWPKTIDLFTSWDMNNVVVCLSNTCLQCFIWTSKGSRNAKKFSTQKPENTALCLWMHCFNDVWDENRKSNGTNNNNNKICDETCKSAWIEIRYFFYWICTSKCQIRTMFASASCVIGESI